MKNKIREKTGNDLPKLSLAQKTGLGRHSRQGSETSLSSLVLEPPLSKEEMTPVQSPTSNNMELTLADGKSLTSKELTKLAKREDEWRSRLEKRDTEWSKKLEKKELELTKIMEEKEKEWRKQEQSMTEDLLKLTRELKEALRVAEESKRKICQYQEDKDQLEGFQMQEIAKIKHLLLAKEQENAENTTALKESLTTIETLKAEVNRLRPFEEQISNFQAVAKSESMDLATRVVAAERQYADIQAECERLQQELDKERDKSKETVREENEIITQLTAELDRCKIVINEDKRQYDELKNTIDKEKREKDEALLRNAQVSQDVEIVRQELRVQQQDTEELYKKQSDLENQLKEKTLELEVTRAECVNLTKRIKELQESSHDRAAASAREQELIQTIAELDNQLADRNKSIRVLQQRLSDMKKTLQRELKANDPGGGGGSIVNEITTMNNHSVPNSRTAILTTADDDVNFKYLKHVLIKFLTSREYEAQHLTRAVATLLRFSPEEERLLRDTLEWRKSWFGSRPRLPKTKPVVPS